ncbi:MAG: patatin-like phospholipase family protein [Dehalococcoidia bacterium]|nr:patatin-like phospholipase family protein [Dehalococcoidia bacterium]
MAKYFRILAIDGGGVRGIIPAQVLASLEDKLKKESGNPDIAIADCFDLVAGTSSGGILTCIYLCPRPDDPLRPRFSAEQALQFYFEAGAKIFHLPLWHKFNSLGGVINERYPADGIESELKSLFHDLRLRDLVTPCLITSYDIERRDAYFFSQQAARRTPARDFFLRDVSRATSAAPTYFDVAGIKSGAGVHYSLIDGGVFANNPAMCAFAEGLVMRGPRKCDPRDILMLSLGTGAVKTPLRYGRARNWGAVQWMRPLVDVMMSSVSETVDYQLRQIFASAENSHLYLRIQTEIRRRNADPDNAEPANLNALKDIGRVVTAKNSARLDVLAKLLLAC